MLALISDIFTLVNAFYMSLPRKGIWGATVHVGSIPTPPRKKPNKKTKEMDITGIILMALVAVTIVAYKYSQSFRDFVEFLDGLEEENQKKIKEERECQE